MLRELSWPRTQRPNVIRPSAKLKKSEKGGYEGFVLGIVTSWAVYDRVLVIVKCYL